MSKYDEDSSSSASPLHSPGCSPSSASTATSRRSILLISVNMSESLFAAWQHRFRQEGQGAIPDSQLQPPQQGAMSQGYAQTPHMSDDDFQRLLNDPPHWNRSSLQPTSETWNTSSLQPTNEFQPREGTAQRQVPTQNNDSSPNLVPANAPSKKRAQKVAPKKGKLAKQTVDISDDSEFEDVADRKRWNDSETCQLISFRSMMDDQFKQNAKKQGINMWEKLQGKMVAACDNFTKSAEACRKKWKSIYAQYCIDKCLLQISGEGRKIICRFFKEIDEGFANVANVRKMIHEDAQGTPNPCPPDINEAWEAQDSAEAPTEGTNQGTSTKEDSPQGSKAPKKTSGEQMTSILTDFVIHSKDMVAHSDRMATQTTRIADDIHLHGIVLKELQVNMARLIEKLLCTQFCLAGFIPRLISVKTYTIQRVDLFDNPWEPHSPIHELYYPPEMLGRK